MNCATKNIADLTKHEYFSYFSTIRSVWIIYTIYKYLLPFAIIAQLVFLNIHFLWFCICNCLWQGIIAQFKYETLFKAWEQKIKERDRERERKNYQRMDDPQSLYVSKAWVMVYIIIFRYFSHLIFLLVNTSHSKQFNAKKIK